jgi:hypothetical protein
MHGLPPCEAKKSPFEPKELMVSELPLELVAVTVLAERAVPTTGFTMSDSTGTR